MTHVAVLSEQGRCVPPGSRLGEHVPAFERNGDTPVTFRALLKDKHNAIARNG